MNNKKLFTFRNESSTMKSLNLKNTTNYVKENYMLSRERMTVYTQYSNEPDMYFEPQFVMKGQGKTKAMKEVQ